MARAIWTGSVSFGLVNVPVGLYSATQDHKVHFHQFEKGTSNRIRNERVNERTGEEVPYRDIVKGAEVGDGAYVMLTQEELESVEPGRSRTIDISDFVEASEIDPLYYQKSYYLAPADDTAKKPYALLVKAMEKAERIGVATFVMRGKQYLAAIRPHDGVLVRGRRPRDTTRRSIVLGCVSEYLRAPRQEQVYRRLAPGTTMLENATFAGWPVRRSAAGR